MQSPPVCEFIKMSKGQRLRALVNERLAAAAEDIFVLFERSIAEYEEELCRSKDENPRIELLRRNVQIPSSCPDPCLNQEITETPQIKEEPEEQSVKQEEEQLPVSVPESSGVCVKTEGSALLQQRQTEHREEVEEEDISSEPHFLPETDRDTEHSSETDTDNCDEWAPPFSCSAAQMETEAGGDHYNQAQIRDRGTELSPQNKSAPETTAHSEDMAGTEGKQHRCPFCEKRFTTKPILKRHIRVHVGHKPFSCSICEKSFAQNWVLDKHVRTHTGEKPYCCPVCKRTFTQKGHLERHVRTHTGEKPYSCSVCERSFANKSQLDRHRRTHTGERPYSCTVCNKTFSHNGSLNSHIRIHTGEKPYCCSVCNKTFTQKGNLNTHSRTHTGETKLLLETIPQITHESPPKAERNRESSVF